MFEDVIVRLILWRHQNATARKIESFRGFLLNISKTVQLILTKLVIFRQSSLVSFEMKRFNPKQAGVGGGGGADSSFS